MKARLVLLAPLLVAACTTPPSSAFVGGAPHAGRPVDLGRIASGEACTQQMRVGGESADVFCGTWVQPSGEVILVGPGGPEALPKLATSGTWRDGVDATAVCEAPRATTILDGQPAQVMACTRRIGGWPEVAMVASVGSRMYAADGILPAAPVLQRAIGVLSGRTAASTAPLPPSGADGLLASRLAAQAFRADDVGQYDTLIAAGLRANQAESFAAAEQAYRAALQLQEKALGPNDPNTATTLTRLALQLSDQQRFAAAAPLFAAAAARVAGAADPLAKAELLHDRGLDMVNQERWDEALALLREAEAAYGAHMTRGALAVSGGAPRVGLGPLMATTAPVMDATEGSALIGVIETRRYQAIALRALGRKEESVATIRSAAALARARDLRQPALTARLSRTAAAIAAATGARGQALTQYARSVFAFTEVLPGTRPLAETTLLRAGQLAESGRGGEALPLCRRAVDLLRQLEIGTSAELLEPCLEVYRGAANGAAEQSVLAEMFAAAQLAQGNITSQQIAFATARLAAGSRDPAVGAAIRRRQDAELRLADLYRARDLRAAAERGQRTDLDLAAMPSAAALDAEIPKAQAALADADAAVQTAAPGYAQLVARVAPADAVLAMLGPGEAFASILPAPVGTWTFVLRGGRIAVGRSAAGEAAIADQVRRLRAGLQERETGPRPFDIAAAQTIYADTLGTVASMLADAQALIVAPSGPLLAIPFGMLLTGPAQPDRLADAPWLIRRHSVAHVPAPANFLALRKLAASSRAARPWFGMGDAVPVTLAQAERSFPSAACAESAKLFADLPRLPLTRLELAAARQLLGGSPSDELLGQAYTAQAVGQADLGHYRVLHFATHALLPAELRCQSEPAIVTSAPPGAPDAAGALLTSSDLMGLKLDADLIILSGCNTAGAGRETGGESLSGLARAFFYAGARSLVVTHWSVSEKTTAFLVADMLRHLRAGDVGGSAASLRQAQLDVLAGAGKKMPANLAHPFFWAPFALIGEGSSRAS